MSLTYLVRRTTVDLDVELAKGLTITQRVFNLEIRNMAHPGCRCFLGNLLSEAYTRPLVHN